MAGLGGVNEHGRRPGRGQGRGDLARDVAGLADPGADDPALGGEQGLYGGGKGRAQAFSHLAEGPGLDLDHPTADGDGIKGAHGATVPAGALTARSASSARRRALAFSRSILARISGVC